MPPVAANPGDEWTSFMHGSFHNSQQSTPESLSAAVAQNLTLLWSFHTQGGVVTEPMVTGDSVYFGSWDGKEYSVNATNGALRWGTYLGQSACTPSSAIQGVSSSATVANRTVFVGGGGDFWDALSISNGAILWKYYTGNSSPVKGGGHYNWASPLVVGDDAYLGTSSHCDLPLVHGSLLKLDLTSHTVVRTFNLTGPNALGADIWSSPALDFASGQVFVATGNQRNSTNGTNDDSIMSFDAGTLKLTGRFQVPYALRVMDGDFGASPTLYRSDRGVPMVADANKDGYLFALQQARLSAGPVWKDQIGTAPTFSSAAFVNGTLFVGTGPSVDASGHPLPGSLRAINASTGKLLWILRMSGPVFGPVAVTGDLVVGAGGHEFAVARATDGRLLFRYNASAIFQGGASIAGGRIFIGNDNGNLLSFGLPLKVNLRAYSATGKPLVVTFTAHASGGAGGYQYQWSFGDGSTSSRFDPNHGYLGPGNYTASVLVSDQAWNRATAQMTVVVTSPTRPALRARPSSSA
ncbi:MAG: PQQ-binding-like beta-propeller repeat protein [Thermoplasmata archaeon]|nr:PQQ-binding-like beta-propeller repeat protein [Thermoplasmata archaeon]